MKTSFGGGKRRLRFGVMCTGERLESAVAASIDELLKIDGVDLALLIVDVSAPAGRSLRATRTEMVSLNGTLWAAYQRLFPLQRLRTIVTHETRSRRDSWRLDRSRWRPHVGRVRAQGPLRARL